MDNYVNFKVKHPSTLLRMTATQAFNVLKFLATARLTFPTIVRLSVVEVCK
jgi:hypothetical protein